MKEKKMDGDPAEKLTRVLMELIPVGIGMMVFSVGIVLRNEAVSTVLITVAAAFCLVSEVLLYRYQARDGIFVIASAICFVLLIVGVIFTIFMNWGPLGVLGSGCFLLLGAGVQVVGKRW